MSYTTNVVYCLYQHRSVTMQNFYSFSALSGLQARQATYVLNIPLAMVGKLFSKEDISLPADQRSQRIINQTRVNQISTYIVENPNTYVLPPLVAYVRSGEIEFKANKEFPNLGELQISMSAQLALFDGQHRASAIQDAITKRKFLDQETITVYILPNGGVAAAQQIFSDINMNAVKPAQSIKLLYNQRDQVTAFTKSLIQEIPLFRKHTDLERTNLPASSDKIFTFSGLYQANQVLWKGLGDNAAKPIIIKDFWERMCYVMQEWEQVNDMAIQAGVLREQSLAAHSITWVALAEAGVHIIQKLSENQAWWHIMGNFSMNWSRQNPLWQGRAINGGKITKTRKNIILMANAIIQKYGIELNKVQQGYEDEFLKSQPTKAHAA